MMPTNVMSEKKILLIDDEQEILGLLEAVLRKEGFRQIETAASGLEGVERCRAWAPDLVVLDIMLPDIDGFEVCRRLREFTYAPVLFLSARADDLDKLLGLGIGGDDYITKPFSPREVAFRIKAQFRRSEYLRGGPESGQQAAGQPAAGQPTAGQPTSGQPINGQQAADPGDPGAAPGGAGRTYRFGEIVIDEERSEVTRGGEPVTLTAKEYQLLLYLAMHPNMILGKQKICDQVWNEPYIGMDNTLMVHIRHLREKLEDDPSSPRWIQTVKGLGYRLSTRG